MELLRQEKRLDSSDPQTWTYWQRRTGNLLANDFFQSGDMMSALAIYKSMLNLGTGPDWQLPVLYQVALCQDACSTSRSPPQAIRESSPRSRRSPRLPLK